MIYKLTHEGYVIRDGDTKISITSTLEFPNTNPDYLEYLAWIEAGNTPIPADPLPIVVPQAVTRRQAKQALLLAGKLSSVQPAIDAIPDPIQRAMVQIEWDDSQMFERNRPALIALGTALGLTSGQLDDLFVQAGTL